jgi:Reverse transcriptase (RNA-dependent DNA polymerase)/Retroviral aspartyl protease
MKTNKLGEILHGKRKRRIHTTCMSKLEINEKETIALFDTGSTVSVIGYEAYLQLKNTENLVRVERIIKTVGGDVLYPYITQLWIKLPGFEEAKIHTFFVLPKVPLILLGLDFMEEFQVEPRILQDCYKHKNKKYPFIRKHEINMRVANIATEKYLKDAKANDVINFKKLISNLGVCPDKNKPELISLLKEFKNEFTEIPGLTNKIEFEVKLKEGAQLKKQSAYPANNFKKRLMDECLDEMLANGTISPCESAVSCPSLVVPKENGKPRFVTDFRDNNGKTIPFSYPLPKIKEIVSNLGGACYFTILDLTKGFNQIPVKESDKWKLAFTCHRGLFTYNRMPFGCMNSPSYFQLLMDRTLGSARWQFTIAYIDDLVIFSKTMEDHLKHLRFVFSKLREAGLKINPEKVQLLCSEFKFLGMTFKRDSEDVLMFPNRKKIKGLDNYPTPTSQSDIRKFNGFVQYYKNLYLICNTF